MVVVPARPPWCTRAAAFSGRLLAALLAVGSMVGTLVWLWSGASALRMAVTWGVFFAAARVYGAAVDVQPGRWAYAAATVAAVSPLVVVLLVYAVWAPIAS